MRRCTPAVKARYSVLSFFFFFRYEKTRVTDITLSRDLNDEIKFVEL